MHTFIDALINIGPYILLLILSFLLEFNIRYIINIKIENFYIRGIRIITLIIIAMKLNYYNGLYSYASFILTYIICAILDNRYRNKFEIYWNEGSKEINKILNKKRKLNLIDYIKIRAKHLKNSYDETYQIFKFKFFASISILFIVFLVSLLFSSL